MIPFRFSALILALSAVQAASAETPSAASAPAAAHNQAGELQTVKVTAPRKADNAYTADEMSAATGLKLSPKDTPQSVSVITRKQMDDLGVSTLEDALKTTTGLNVYKQGYQTRYQSRGFDIAQISEDGVNSTVCTMCGNNPHDQKQLSDTFLYERIEVVRGATGLRKAQSEPGGSINAVRKRPTTRRHIELTASADRYKTLRSGVDVSGTLSESAQLRGRAVALAERSVGFQKHVDGNKAFLYGVLDKRFGEGGKLTVGGLYHHEHDTPPLFGLPADGKGNDLRLSRDTYLGAEWNRSRYRKLNAFAEWEQNFNEDWKLTALADYKQNKSVTEYAYVPNRSGVASDGTVSDGWVGRSDRYNHQWSFHADLEGKYPLFGRKHELYAGYSYTREKFDNLWRGSRLSGRYPVRAWTGSEINKPDWSSAAYKEIRKTVPDTHTLTLATRLNLTGRLHLLLGTSYSRWRQSQYLSWMKEPYSYGHKGRFVPYAAATFDLTPHNTLYASYTSIFQNSTGYYDAEDKQLPPVTGNSYEIGWKGSFRDGRLDTTLAVFQTQKNNYPGNTRERHPRTDNWIFTPVTQQSRGFDAEIAGSITDNWQLFAGYTYNRRRYSKTAAASTAAQNGKGVDFSQHTPKHIFRLNTVYRLPGVARKWLLTGGVSVQSKSSPITVDGRKHYLGGYAVWHAGVQYEPNPAMRLALKIDNLTNRRYYESYAHRGTNQGHFYGVPRNISLSFRWKM